MSPLVKSNVLTSLTLGHFDLFLYTVHGITHYVSLGLASFAQYYVREFLPCCRIDLGHILEVELTGLGDSPIIFGQTTSPL